MAAIDATPAHAHGAGSGVAILLMAAIFPVGAFLAYLTKKLRDRFIPWWTVRYRRSWVMLAIYYTVILIVLLADWIGIR